MRLMFALGTGQVWIAGAVVSTLFRHLGGIVFQPRVSYLLTEDAYIVSSCQPHPDLGGLTFGGH